MLPPDDTKYLMERVGNGRYSISIESNMICLLFPDFQLPQGFDREKSDLLLRLQPGYPDVHPDMWWFDPPIHRADTLPIPQTEVTEHYLCRNWQRWSRHIPPEQWHPGTDGLETFLALLRKELERCVRRAA